MAIFKLFSVMCQQMYLNFMYLYPFPSLRTVEFECGISGRDVFQMFMELTVHCY